MEIKKTVALNTLIDFYGSLLTSKQRNYLELYYQQDFSLGEISDHYQVSRQAVYDNIKRSEKLLVQYEEKLHLVKDFRMRDEKQEALLKYVNRHYQQDQALVAMVEDLYREEN